MTTARTVIVAALAALLLAAASLVGLAILLPSGPFAPQGGPPLGSVCTAPSFAGETVNVTLSDMGTGMRGGPSMRGAMRLWADRTSVPRGKVSFDVTNAGSLTHELVVLPLPNGQAPGSRTVRADGRADEADSAGEASASCADGAGEGILPGSVSWVTLELKPGRYELVCNLPGHYSAGMYAVLTVT